MSNPWTVIYTDDSAPIKTTIEVMRVVSGSLFKTIEERYDSADAFIEELAVSMAFVPGVIWGLSELISHGDWNADTNTPEILSSQGVLDHYFDVSVTGSTDIDGETGWTATDWIYFDGLIWIRVPTGSQGDYPVFRVISTKNRTPTEDDTIIVSQPADPDDEPPIFF